MTDFVHDPIALSQALIRQPTVNPCHDGAQDVLADALESLGFRTKRYHFDGVDNLYARLGGAAPNFCFAGHTDVVPVGDAAGWTVDPFGAEIRNGIMYGRGTSDMKGAIAAFVSAAADRSTRSSRRSASRATRPTRRSPPTRCRSCSMRCRNSAT